jgi:hypothetical protein
MIWLKLNTSVESAHRKKLWLGKVGTLTPAEDLLGEIMREKSYEKSNEREDTTLARGGYSVAVVP